MAEMPKKANSPQQNRNIQRPTGSKRRLSRPLFPLVETMELSLIQPQSTLHTASFTLGARVQLPLPTI